MTRVQTDEWIVLLGFNGAWHLGAKRGTQILQRASKMADVLMGVECREIEGCEVLDPNLWWVIQWRKDAGTRGNLIALRKDRVTPVGLPQHFFGADHSGLNTRWWVMQDIWVRPTLSSPRGYYRTLILGHLPPLRYPQLWLPMMRRLQGIRKQARYRPLIYADWNRLARLVAFFLGMRVQMFHVTGWAYPWRLRVPQADRVEVGSDHKAVRIGMRRGLKPKRVARRLKRKRGR